MLSSWNGSNCTYEKKKLSGATFKVTAGADIYKADGTKVYSCLLYTSVERRLIIMRRVMGVVETVILEILRRILRIILGALKLVLGLARIILLLFAMVARIFLSFVRMGTF